MYHRGLLTEHMENGKMFKYSSGGGSGGKMVREVGVGGREK